MFSASLKTLIGTVAHACGLLPVPSQHILKRSRQVKLTLALAAVAVPINTLFGISAALLIARNNFPGKTVLLAILDLPFSISPVVTGLMLVGDCCGTPNI